MTTFEYIQWKSNKQNYKSKIFRQVNNNNLTPNHDLTEEGVPPHLPNEVEDAAVIPINDTNKVVPTL
jgi:hypothetical protein